MSGNSVLNIQAVTASIAAMTVGSVNIFDLNAIPEQVFPRQCPVLFPDPQSFFGEANAVRGSLRDFWLATRQVNYRLLYAAVGENRGIFSHYPGFASVVDALVTALVEEDLGEVDILKVSVGQFGVVTDAAKQSFFGCIIGLTLQEKIQG